MFIIWPWLKIGSRNLKNLNPGLFYSKFTGAIHRHSDPSQFFGRKLWLSANGAARQAAVRGRNVAVHGAFFIGVAIPLGLETQAARRSHKRVLYCTNEAANM